jgi:hypothetical protein
MIESYWAEPAQDPSVSPDGRHLAFDLQTVLGANIGMLNK